MEGQWNDRLKLPTISVKQAIAIAENEYSIVVTAKQMIRWVENAGCYTQPGGTGFKIYINEEGLRRMLDGKNHRTTTSGNTAPDTENETTGTRPGPRRKTEASATPQGTGTSARKKARSTAAG